MIKTAFLFLFIVIGIPVSSTSTLPITMHDEDRIIGEWYTEIRRSIIEVTKLAGKFYGKITWVESGKPRKDIHNSDESKRDKLITEVYVMRDFVYNKANGEYEDGYIYNISNGKEYCGKVYFKGENTIIARGFIGFSLFGKDMKLTRVE